MKKRCPLTALAWFLAAPCLPAETNVPAHANIAHAPWPGHAKCSGQEKDNGASAFSVLGTAQSAKNLFLTKVARSAHPKTSEVLKTSEV